MPAALTTLVTINVFCAATEVLIVPLPFAPAGVDTLGEAVERGAAQLTAGSHAVATLALLQIELKRLRRNVFHVVKTPQIQLFFFLNLIKTKKPDDLKTLQR